MRALVVRSSLGRCWPTLPVRSPDINPHRAAGAALGTPTDRIMVKMSDKTEYRHPCPGGCGAYIENHLFACRRDWFRLPAEIRYAIRTTYKSIQTTRQSGRMAHARALSDGIEWFREHPQQSAAANA